MPYIPMPFVVEQTHRGEPSYDIYSLPHSRIMIHQPSGGFGGQASDIELHAKEILRLKAKLNEILMKHTGQPLDRIEKDTDRDYFMGAGEAKEYGLIDEVVIKKPASQPK